MSMQASPFSGMRVGVVGLGAMGRHHARVYSEMKGVNLVGVADADLCRAQEIGGRFATQSFRDYRHLLDLGLDAVSIAVPTSMHDGVAVDILRAGANVLVEKPIAASLEQADLIIREAEEAHRLLMVGHIERFNPAVVALRDMVKAERLISLSMTRVGPIPPRITDVGIIVDLAVHDIDLAQFITGAQFSEIVAYAARPDSGREDTALLMFKMSDGVLVQAMANWLTPFKLRRLQAATRELLVDADLITQQVRVFSGYQLDGSYVVRDLPVRVAEPLRLELEAFLSAVSLKLPSPVPGSDARTALAVALQASCG